MSSALRCHQLQRQILSCERRLLLHSFRPHCPTHRPPITLARLQYPRHASHQSQVSAKNTPNQKSKSTPSKYPPIKPDPHKIWLREQAHLANPRPTFDPKGKYKFKLTGESLYQKQRRVDKQVATALFLFIGIIVVTQIWLPRNPKFPGGYKLDNDSAISDEDRKKFEDAVKGGNVVIKEATNVGDTVETVPSGSKNVSPLPKQIYLPAAPIGDDQVLEEYTLLGNGVRSVSFLGIQVYVMAFYVATSSLPTLQQHLLHTLDIPSTATTATLPEREALKAKLLSDKGSIEFFSALLDTREGNGVRTAIRVVPTRSTDYPHLRDGWVRGIQGKTTIDPEIYDDDAFVDSIGRFKAIFGGRKAVPKGRALILLRDENGALFAYGPDEAVKDKELKLLSEGAKKKESMHGLKMLGVMDDPRVARALWLCYFAGKKVASEGARSSVVDGLVEVVSRPVGSTEGKVV
ncbi:Altered inheritance of mitochondria protein 18 mitochondrial [Orbilia oligospora]|uniref:Altered inheritance of mitochondria protein 18 mitochondrial n=1 Tax=Orbilia oligospora TaxID=2813651 RepID=A0A7C8P7E5_ORBOL|nr:Altered inheritance of mitochondria protein 18 mitochondrial [Orbilia oligospora]KAF3196864.1 Altered inheritance of mitochondria protein 18 mitochondrial [Orbilia oligospora]